MRRNFSIYTMLLLSLAICGSTTALAQPRITDEEQASVADEKQASQERVDEVKKALQEAESGTTDKEPQPKIDIGFPTDEFATPSKGRKRGHSGGIKSKHPRLKGRVSVQEKQSARKGSKATEQPDPQAWEIVGENSAGEVRWMRKRDGLIKTFRKQNLVEK